MLGDRLRILRQIKGLKQSAVAQKIGISTTTYSGWEQNGSYPSYKMACELAKLFEVDVSVILDNKPHQITITI